MKNKRTKKMFVCAMFVVVISLLTLPLAATDINSLVENAKQKSDQYKSIELSYQQSMNNYRLQNSSQGTSVLLNIGETAVVKDGEYCFPESSLSVTLPEFVDGLGISANASVAGSSSASMGTATSGIKIGKAVYANLGGEVSYSRDFVFGASGEKNIEDRMTLLQLQLNYEKSILQFENSVMEDLVSILQLEQQVSQNTVNYERNRLSFNNKIKLGELTEGSLNYLKEKMSIEKENVSLQASVERLENLKESFFHNYGIEYDKVEVNSDSDLEFEPDFNGNTTVYMAYLQMITAKDELDEAAGNSSVLSVSGGVKAGYEFSKAEDGKGFAGNAKAGVSYTFGDFKVGTTVSSDLSTSGFAQPTVTVSGKWGKSSNSDISLSNLNIAYLKAESSYNDALYSYNTSSKELESSISTHEIERQALELQTEYDNLILEAKKTLYEKGLCTLNDLQDAQSSVENDQLDMTVLKLQGLILQNKIKIQEL